MLWGAAGDVRFEQDCSSCNAMKRVSCLQSRRPFPRSTKKKSKEAKNTDERKSSVWISATKVAHGVESVCVDGGSWIDSLVLHSTFHDDKPDEVGG